MSDKIFLDTNIIIYAHIDNDLVKQKKAQSIIEEGETFISTQVLQETANTLKKKLKQTYPDIKRVLSDLISNNFIHINNSQTVLRACEVAGKYGFSFYDSLIISAALEVNATVLYSEDMSNGLVIENQLKIINPF